MSKNKVLVKTKDAVSGGKAILVYSLPKAVGYIKRCQQDAYEDEDGDNIVTNLFLGAVFNLCALLCIICFVFLNFPTGLLMMFTALLAGAGIGIFTLICTNKLDIDKLLLEVLPALLFLFFWILARMRFAGLWKCIKTESADSNRPR